MNPIETVIVIRSLVPGGVAQQDGRLIPGDRLVFVNDENLENASLDMAVQALKGAPKGKVRIGVAKPLPLPECGSHQVSASEVWSSHQAMSLQSHNTSHLQYIQQLIHDHGGRLPRHSVPSAAVLSLFQAEHF